jgi:hypothetical protein
MALTDEQRQRIREEEIERLRVRRELSGDPQPQPSPGGFGGNHQIRKTIIFWVVLIAVAVWLWSVVKSSHNH